MRDHHVNRLLNALPEADQGSLSPFLEVVALPVESVLFEAGERPRYVHFVTSGLVSLVTRMQSGICVEAGIIGSEGFPESLHTLGPEAGNKRAVVQLAGSALRVEFSRFQDAFESSPAVRRGVLRYVQYDALVLSQLSACNSLHTVSERLARWLLMVQDRTGQSTIALSQQFLGQMLATRRSSVSVAAGVLQRAGMIRYKRADIQITEREQLLAASCECTGTVHDLLARLYSWQADAPTVQ